MAVDVQPIKPHTHTQTDTTAAVHINVSSPAAAVVEKEKKEKKKRKRMHVDDVKIGYTCVFAHVLFFARALRVLCVCVCVCDVFMCKRSAVCEQALMLVHIL